MMRSLTRLGFAAAAMAVASCAPVELPLVHNAGNGRIEPLYAAAVAGDVAIVRVRTNGCTRKDDLYPQLTRGVGQAVLTIRRTHQDSCSDGENNGLELQWTFEELGLPSGTLLVVNNPLHSDGVLAGQR